MLKMWKVCLLFWAVATVVGCGSGSSGTGTKAPITPVTPVITWATPTPATVGNMLGASQLDASTTVAGKFVYTPGAGTVLTTAGNTVLTTTFTPDDTADYTTATASVTLTVNPAQTFITASVDFGTTYQTIRGFGGSTAWMPQLTTAQTDALFGQTGSDVGLSMLRVRIDPGGEPNWGTELANAQQARALGASVIATPWTPPASMKSNDNTVMGSLNPGSYGDYANYLESYVTYMAKNNVPLYGISMQNEPDANVSYESCAWTPAEMDAWVANNASVLTTKLIMPESESFSPAYSDAALNDANAVGNIGIVAGHLYGASPAYYVNAENKGKEVWMTEHYLTPTDAEPTIADAIAAAEEVHASLTTGEYNAYFWWWALDWNPGAGVTNYGLVDTNNNTTYYGYALGQFSRFVRPGYVRANAAANPAPGVYVSAYKGSGNEVIVAINANAMAATVNFVLQNATATSMTPYQTTASGGLEPLPELKVGAQNFTSTLLPQSITTFVAVPPVSNSIFEPGDSLVSGGQDGDALDNTPFFLENISGRLTYNLGYQGTSSTQIAIGIGAESTNAVGSVAIPACTNSAGCGGVGVSFPAGKNPNVQPSAYPFYNPYQFNLPGTLGGVSGVLTCPVSCGSGSGYIFTPNEVTPGGTFTTPVWQTNLSVAGIDTGTCVIEGGYNNYRSTATVEADIAAMMAMPCSKSGALQGIPYANTADQWIGGGANRSAIDALNAWEANTYPTQAIDIDGMFVSAVCPLAVVQADPESVIDCGHGVTPVLFRAQDTDGTIAASIDASTCTIPLTGLTNGGRTFGTGVTITIGTEKIYVSAYSEGTVTGCTRGYASTAATSHGAGQAFTAVNSLHFNGLGYRYVAQWDWAVTLALHP